MKKERGGHHFHDSPSKWTQTSVFCYLLLTQYLPHFEHAEVIPGSQIFYYWYDYTCTCMSIHLSDLFADVPHYCIELCSA
jgi:hypothetical protein